MWNICPNNNKQINNVSIFDDIKLGRPRIKFKNSMSDSYMQSVGDGGLSDSRFGPFYTIMNYTIWDLVKNILIELYYKCNNLGA